MLAAAFTEYSDADYKVVLRTKGTNDDDYWDLQMRFCCSLHPEQPGGIRFLSDGDPET